MNTHFPFIEVIGSGPAQLNRETFASKRILLKELGYRLLTDPSRGVNATGSGVGLVE